jgi:hypothetical protein
VSDLPAFPEVRPIELADRELLAGLLRELRPEQSELTFTNLFIWRDAHGLQLTRVDDAVAIFSWRADPEDSFVFPPFGHRATAETVRRCLEHLAANGHEPVMERATQRDLARLGIEQSDFAIQPDRDNWDYVYTVTDLIELHGNRYHKKRNHIEQFVKQYEFAYRPLTLGLVPDCQELQDRWCDEKHCDLVSTLRAEARAVKETLQNFAQLGVTGGCTEVDGAMEAFALGELLNSDTVVIHIEKANAAFHGLYQVINQQFLEHEWSTVEYVNREQDMGVSGLRRAKQSYHPHHMVEKHRVQLQD